MNKTEKYLTIGVYQNIHQAYITRDLLILHRIKAFVLGEETVMNNPFYSDNLGGAQLRVAESQFDEARRLLESMDTAKNN